MAAIDLMFARAICTSMFESGATVKEVVFGLIKALDEVAREENLTFSQLSDIGHELDHNQQVTLLALVDGINPL